MKSIDNFYLAYSELTKRVYITDGKSKKDVTDWINQYISIVNSKSNNRNVHPSSNA